MVSARAVKPWVSKKFLAARCPGSAAASTPMQPAARQCSTSVPMSTSPTPTARGGLLDEQVGHHAEARTGAQLLDHDRAEAEHDVVDGADDEQRVVAREQRVVGVGEGLGPRLALEPQRAAAHRRRARRA